MGALVGAPVEQRHHRHDRPVIHGHQPAVGRRSAAARTQGDLPPGARRGRLPRRRRLGRSARRRLHPAVARSRDDDGPDPAGRPGQQPRVGDQGAPGPPDGRRHLHRPAAAQRAPRRRSGVRRSVLQGALGDQRDRQGQGAGILRVRRVRPVPARHSPAVREPQQARHPDQDDRRPVGPPAGLERGRDRRRRVRLAAGAAAALVRPLPQGRERSDPRHRHREPDLLRAGHRGVAEELVVDPLVPQGRDAQAVRHVGAPRSARRTHLGHADRRHLEPLPGPGRRPVHPLGQPVDRRAAQPGRSRTCRASRTTSSTTRPAPSSPPSR